VYRGSSFEMAGFQAQAPARGRAYFQGQRVRHAALKLQRADQACSYGKLDVPGMVGMEPASVLPFSSFLGGEVTIKTRVTVIVSVVFSARPVGETGRLYAMLKE
jgi:hypothetical protein